jgi:hypothetical protein
MTKYNGHRSWNAWNVSLWIANEEPLYRRAIELKRKYGSQRAARLFLCELDDKTPDGATYNVTCVREALAGLE